MTYRKTYINQVAQSYLQANKKQKSTILDELCLNCEYTRKHAIKSLNKPMKINESPYKAAKPGPNT